VGALLLAAFALMLVLEGILPLVAPTRWREFVARMAALKDGQLRFFGLVAVVGGALLFFAAGLF